MTKHNYKKKETYFSTEIASILLKEYLERATKTNYSSRKDNFENNPKLVKNMTINYYVINNYYINIVPIIILALGLGGLWLLSQYGEINDYRS